jgi:hypothetical protein
MGKGEEIVGEVKAIATEVYKDAAQPAVREVGATGGAVAKLILSPIRLLLERGAAGLTDWLDGRLRKRVEAIPPERLIAADPRIAIPALQGLAQAFDDGTLREMFATLLASTIDTQSASLAHPSFVEVLKQLTADEAKILALLVRDPVQRIFQLWEPLALMASRLGVPLATPLPPGLGPIR